MMIPEFGRSFTLTWILELRGMRSQTNCRNTAKVEPTTDRGSERWRSGSRWKSRARNELNDFEQEEGHTASRCHSHA
jgi:hypothetical protein